MMKDAKSLEIGLGSKALSQNYLLRETMSIDIVHKEIKRFLTENTPEVLCISGKWGVGKTFAWKKYLSQVDESKQLAMKRYAYVSLFGLNSLDEVRYSIVENTIDSNMLSHDPDIITLDIPRRFVNKTFRKNRSLIEAAANAFKYKEAGEALYRLAFLAVRRQLVCLDDFERAGKSLSSNDILGLASMLREQRECKIVFLLNQDALEEESKDIFKKQLEKVVDTFIVFEPTCDDVLNICVDCVDDVAKKMRDRIKLLNIKNIRVIKKIEKWVRRTEEILKGSEPEVLDQAISTVVLSGWAVLQPSDAPSVEFIQSGLRWLAPSMREEINPQEQKWKDILEKYEYNNTDFDVALIKSLSNGYFDIDDILTQAEILNSRVKLGQKTSAIGKAWQLYWSNLYLDDQVILQSLYDSAIENIEIISLMDLNGIIRILRKYHNELKADKLIELYINKIQDDPNLSSRSSTELFFNTVPDSELIAAISKKINQALDKRDPVERLKQLSEGTGFNPEEDVRLISNITEEEWRKIIYTPDKNIGKILKWARRLSDQPEPEPEAISIRTNLNAALSDVAERSPMRRDRLLDWGVLPPEVTEP